MIWIVRKLCTGHAIGWRRAISWISCCTTIIIVFTSRPVLVESKIDQPAVSATATASAEPTAMSDGTSLRLVPAGTRIPVSLTDKVSSATAQAGDIIAVSATEDVVVDGYVVVSKGAGGQAEIASVERAHGNGGSGKLGIKMDWIAAIDGERILLTSTLKSASEDDRGGGSSTATILTYALLGPLGLFAHNFAHGKDIVIDQSKVLTAFTDASVHIVSTTVSQKPIIAH